MANEGGSDFHHHFPGQDGGLAAMYDTALRRVLYAGLGDEKAAAIELLHDVCPPDPPEDYDPRPWIAQQAWVTARSGDHQYVLLRCSTDWREQVRFIRWLRVWGYEEKFHGSKYRCRDIDGQHMWAMTDLNDTISNRRAIPRAPSTASPQLRMEV